MSPDQIWISIGTCDVVVGGHMHALKALPPILLILFPIFAASAFWFCSTRTLIIIYKKQPKSNNYRISANSFRGNYSIYEVKKCHNAETIWKFPHFPLSKKNSFRGNYLRKLFIFESVKCGNFHIVYALWQFFTS